MLHISYSLIENFVKNLQVKVYNIRIQRNSNYWVIKVNGHDICRFYGTKNKLSGIAFKTQYCSKV